ncbi:MAG TPA: glycosyltransferase family 4 protein, partial [Tepidisphaeraceae bacterium]|nr:glycosyltransferase family 4 protein [Tepidisphaeraceae bacterium]
VSVVASSFAAQHQDPSDVLLPARGATRAGRYRRFLDALDGHLDRTRYDIVHAMLPVRRCDVYHPHAGIAAEAVARGHLKYDGPIRQAMARTGNRLNQRRQMFARVERDVLNAPDPPVVLCLSEYVKGFVRRHYNLPDSKLATLFNAVDLARFDPQRPEAGYQVRQRLGIAADSVVGLMIAQDFARKGLREAILARSHITKRNLVLLVVGKEDPAPYRELARRTETSERVIFAGPTSDPHAFYQAADFFVLPTKHDPCSLVVLESLAMGVPVISTRFNGACEIMREGVHGFVLNDPTDVETLADRMRRMTHLEARRLMSNACLDLRPRLSYEHHLDQLLSVYQQVNRP